MEGRPPNIDYTAGLEPVQAPRWPGNMEDLEIPQPVDMGDRAAEGLQAVHVDPWLPAKIANYQNQRPISAIGPKKILGLRRTTFFLTVSNLVLAVGLVVLGVLTRRIETSTISDPAANGTNPTTSGTNTTTNGTSLQPAHEDSTNVCFHTNNPPSAGVNPGSTVSECPLPAAQRRYTVPGTNLTFQRECDMDYIGGDMARFPVRSMPDCLALCAQLNLAPSSALGRCVGATWVYDPSRWGLQGTGIAFCFPKNKTDARARDSKGGVESAVLLGS